VWAKTIVWARGIAALWAGVIGLLVVLQGLKVFPEAPRAEPYVWVVSLMIIAVDTFSANTT
jgi:hypothetical protein